MIHVLNILKKDGLILVLMTFNVKHMILFYREAEEYPSIILVMALWCIRKDCILVTLPLFNPALHQHFLKL